MLGFGTAQDNLISAIAQGKKLQRVTPVQSNPKPFLTSINTTVSVNTTTYGGSTRADDELTKKKKKKEKVDRSGYGLIQIIRYLFEEMEEGNFNFAFCWMIILGCNLFILIYGGINLYTYECPDTCDLTTSEASYYYDYDCSSACESIEDDSYYYSYSYDCGLDINGSTVYCEQSHNSFWERAMIFVPVVDVCLLFLYFLCFFRLNIIKCLFFAIFFIPMSIIMFAFTTIITVFTCVVSPILIWTFVVNDSKTRNVKSAVLDNDYKDYKDINNNATHFHLIGAIAQNRDYRFLVLWAILFGCTLGVVIIYGSKIANDSIICPGCVDCYTYGCDETYDVGYSCGTDSFGSTINCIENDSAELDRYRMYIAGAYCIDYLIIVFLWLCMCRVGIAKACILAIPTCIMMLGAAVPFTVLGAIGAMFAMFVCY